MKNFLVVLCLTLATGLALFESCKKEPPEPPEAEIASTILDNQVTFTAVTERVETWKWDFGDGSTSVEQNPVHVFVESGSYLVTLTGTDINGTQIVATTHIVITLTPQIFLTGGASAVNGKTWRLTVNHSTLDRIANADAALTVADGTPAVLPPDIFSSYMGMGEVYDDEFTFFSNGSYTHDTKEDHAAFSGIIYEYLTTGGDEIVNNGGQDFGLCTGLYTPGQGATFTFVEKENLSVPSVYGTDGILTFENVSTLDFSGTEFIGLMDNQRKVIVQELTNTSMRLVMFMAASPDYYPLNTHALILTFEVVR